jgi:hypothetical protein
MFERSKSVPHASARIYMLRHSQAWKVTRAGVGETDSVEGTSAGSTPVTSLALHAGQMLRYEFVGGLGCDFVLAVRPRKTRNPQIRFRKECRFDLDHLHRLLRRPRRCAR